MPRRSYITSSILALPRRRTYRHMYIYIHTYTSARTHVRYVSGRVTLDARESRWNMDLTASRIYIRCVWGTLHFCSVKNSTHRRGQNNFHSFVCDTSESICITSSSLKQLKFCKPSGRSCYITGKTHRS